MRAAMQRGRRTSAEGHSALRRGRAGPVSVEPRAVGKPAQANDCHDKRPQMDGAQSEVSCLSECRIAAWPALCRQLTRFAEHGDGSSQKSAARCSIGVALARP
jgi:hypothetical protein